MGRRRQLFWGVALIPLIAVLGTVAAWAIDTGAAGGEVLRNVELAETDVGGLGADDLLMRIESLDETLGARTVRIETPTADYETTSAEIGLSVDAVATAEATLDVGRDDVLPLRPFSWLASFFSPREADVHYVVDVETARATLRQLEGDAQVSPTEPTIRSIEGDPFDVVPGVPGTGIDPDALSVALTAAARTTPTAEPVTVRIQQSALDPRLGDDVAEAAAAAANERTAQTLSITASNGEASETIQLVPRELRSLVVAQEVEEGIAISLDPEGLQAVLVEELAELDRQAADAGFDLVGGEVVITPSQTGIACCSPDAVETVQSAFDAGAREVTVELDETQPSFTSEDAEALGIVAEVGSPTEFGPTTNHACCQNRVTNIHRIADIVRGAVIRPGETFSVNDFVGRRTVEKGFVSDGVIYDGVLTQDVGGGISQFATTLFNASLFAGLDFGEYQSHSLYISRYPRGHEATISFPAPDLQIVNSSDYGVMIWPTYTDTSLTVHLYSTPNIEVSVGDPSPSPQGNCTRWTTPRTRTYEDGRTEQDTVFALYRPAEGVNC